MTATPTFDAATPNPGSDEAIAQGCTCPIMDNSHGAGWLGSDQFWITEGCPLHDDGAATSSGGKG